MRRTPPLIVGAGPAGCAAALALARAGAAPRVFERQRATGDALCGGFLSWRTLGALRRLGVTLDAPAITRVRLFACDRRVEAALPDPGCGVSRHRLDTVLQAEAARAGARIERGVTVRGSEDGTLRVDGDALPRTDIFLATGKSDLRGLARPRTSEDPTLGLRLRLAPHPRLTTLLAGAIELHLFDRGYAGLLLQEDGSANLCLAVRKSRFAEAGGDPAALLARAGSALGDRLAVHGVLPIADAVAAVPYGWRAPTTLPGLYRIGDQAAVIPSLAGEGLGIAVASGSAAAAAWLAGVDAPRFQRAFARRTRRAVGLAAMLWHGAESPRFADAALKVLAGAPALLPLAARLTRVAH